MSKEARKFSVLRGINWGMSLLLGFGFFKLVLASNRLNDYFVLAVSFLFITLLNYIFTAIVATRELPMLFGYPINIGPKGYATLIFSNAVLALFGLSILVTCVMSQQYPASISGVMYLVLSALNVKALYECKA